MTLEGYPQLTTLVAIVLANQPDLSGLVPTQGGSPSCNWSSGHVSWVEGPWGQDLGVGKG